MAGIILSGGENSRMGRNKAFLTFQGRLFLTRIIEALNPLFEDLILVTREPERYAGFPVQIVKDLFPDRGPLTGLFSGLSASSDPANFCVGCDMPMVQTRLVQYMMNRAWGCDAVIPSLEGTAPDGVFPMEPLHAVYRKSCLPVMERNLRQGRRSLYELVRSLNVKFLGTGELARVDRGLRSFRNINVPEEYRALTAETNSL